MIIARSQTVLAKTIQDFKEKGKIIGFVPTMGALHDGHLSLVKTAREHADIVTVSIFVNPTQFAPHEDFATYPRHEESDLAMLRGLNVDLVYLPSEQDLYPNGKEITIKAGQAAKGLESDFRPHFFDGVATVVHRLFTQMQADIAVFGEKDFQQLQVIREMVATHNLPVRIIGGETMRDARGLALSSRNAYLSTAEYEIACALNRIIRDCAASLKTNPDQALQDAMQAILAAGFNSVDYVALQWNRILVAAYLGKTRLIDNIAVPD